jgi:uncharacterized glyoxalase superfamily metalloenzyme YdcJ
MFGNNLCWRGESWKVKEKGKKRKAAHSISETNVTFRFHFEEEKSGKHFFKLRAALFFKDGTASYANPIIQLLTKTSNSICRQRGISTDKLISIKALHLHFRRRIRFFAGKNGLTHFFLPKSRMN